MTFVSCSVTFPGNRLNTSSTDLSAILPEEVEQEVKEAAEISMGTEVSEEDIINVKYLCEQVGLSSVIWGTLHIKAG